MIGNVLARLTALGVMTIQEFKQHWREPFGSELLAYSHRLLESLLAHQIQELAYNGLDHAAARGPEPAARRWLDRCAPEVHRPWPMDRRHEADPRVAARRAYGYPERLRMAVLALQFALLGGLGDHRHTSERLGAAEPEGHDDGGFSGGMLERPALKRIQMGRDNQRQLSVDGSDRHKLGILASSQELSESPPSPAGFRRFGGVHGPSVHVVAASCRES